MSRLVGFRALVAGSLAVAGAAVPFSTSLAAAPAAPVVTADPGTHTVQIPLAGDTFVSSSGQTTTSQSTSPELWVGSKNLGFTKSRTYLDFDYAPLAALPARAVISSAQLTLSDFVTGSCKGTAIRASRVTSSWTLDGVTWKTQPTATTTGSGTSTAAYGAGACPTEGPVTFDVKAIVSAWLGGSAELGVQVKADKEGAASGYRQYRSAENGDAAKAPTLTVTYNTPPDKPTNVTVAPGANGYATSLTPTLSAKVTDPDGDDVRGYFEVYAKSNTFPLTPTWSGYSPMVASGDQASVTVPAGTLTEGSTYAVVAYGDDGTLRSTSSADAVGFKVDTIAPDVTISSDVYTNGEWLNAAPTSSTFTFDGSADTVGFYLNTDGIDHGVGTNAAGGDYTVTWTPPAGWHVIKAKPIDKAGNVGAEQTFAFGVGSPAFLAPTEWEGSTADFPVLMTAPQGATGATLLWRVYGETTWHTATHIDDGTIPWDGSVSNDGGHASTPMLTWHATQEPFGTGKLHGPAYVQVRGCFHYTGAADACTADRFVQLAAPQ